MEVQSAQNGICVHGNVCVCVCTKALGALSQVKVDVFAQEGDSAFSSFLAFCVSFKVSVACWKVPS